MKFQLQLAMGHGLEQGQPAMHRIGGDAAGYFLRF
jgi:hypothetical protein